MTLALTSGFVIDNKKAEARTYVGLQNGSYYYTDWDYGSTTVRISGGKLYFRGKVEYHGSTFASGSFRLKLKRNARIVASEEGTMFSIARSSFNSYIRSGCSIWFKMKNNKVTKINVGAFTG